MTRPTVAELVQLLGLSPHPEGGFFKETFRDSGEVDAAALPPAFGGSRSFSTAIYFLVPRGSVSRLHRIRSAEVWHFYLGSSALTVYEIDANTGAEKRTLLGADVAAGQRLQARRPMQPSSLAALTHCAAQYVVPAGAWFGSHLADDSAAAGPPVPASPDSRDYALVGCTVAPGFDFADFALATRSELLRAFPHATADITRLTDQE